ncbi:hypothetical protein ANN_13327 [Periplaneta americana]|uniref:Uncharacterized protein n=1 Tax=Periplaneta americana TaxID=6978 RepID=A0ABQ8TLI0_PERAM|nr:hypothetical protein ANN_13327 [Periplaneta americana]
MPKFSKPLKIKLHAYVSEFGAHVFSTDGTVLLCKDDNNALSESAMRISYKICREIAKELKTFNEGAFIKRCLIIMADELCPQQASYLRLAYRNDRWSESSKERNSFSRYFIQCIVPVTTERFDEFGKLEYMSKPEQASQSSTRVCVRICVSIRRPEFECSGPQLEGPEFECSGPQLEGPEFEYSELSLKYEAIWSVTISQLNFQSSASLDDREISSRLDDSGA